MVITVAYFTWVQLTDVQTQVKIKIANADFQKQMKINVTQSLTSYVL